MNLEQVMLFRDHANLALRSHIVNLIENPFYSNKFLLTEFKRMKGLFFLGLCISPLYYAQQVPKDSLKTQVLESIRFTKRIPVTKEIIYVQKELGSKNLGQDLPFLLKNQTSVVATSDAGNGVGYTGFRIRGVGGNSINVMLNGVPYNDSESMGTFFVNIPDFASSASQIIIQRGIGTSTNGVSAFGASVNVLSKDPDENFSVKTEDSYGSYNTYKLSAEINSGTFWKNRLSVMGRISKIHSDGYIDRAFSQLNSYNFIALFKEGNTTLRFLTFGGKEKTYQAWNGIDKTTWENNPRFNPAGAIYKEDWTEVKGFYDDETDNYKQKHYQLLWTQTLSPHWNLETTLHYTQGKGFYNNYKQDAKFSKYNLPNFIEGTQEIKKTDFIRKKWLDNDFYGMVATLYGTLDALDFNFGMVANQYKGRHFGNVSAVYFPSIFEHEYYRNRSVKNEVSGYAKGILRRELWDIFLDIQLRNISYDAKILSPGDHEGMNLNKNWTFINPKAGVSYKIPHGKLYFSYANAKREPNRDDLEANPETQPEELHDFEAGIERNIGILNYSITAYYMYYVNQLVLTGAVNDVGAFIRANSGKSFRTGLELNIGLKLSEKWHLFGNATLSENKNLDFKTESSSGIQNLGRTSISFSPALIGNIRLGFSPQKDLSLMLQNQYISRQYLDNTQQNSVCIPGFFLTDLNAEYTLDLKRTAVSFKFLLNNIFNKKYISNGVVYDSQPYYFTQARRNMMFGVSLRFK